MIRAFQRAVGKIEDRLTIRQQIGMAMTLLCVAIVSIISVSAYSLSTRQAQRLVGAEMIRITETLSGRLDRVLQGRLTQIKNLAAIDIVRVNAGENPQTLLPLLQRVMTSYPDYEWVGIVSPDGMLKVDSKNLGEMAVADQPWFQQGLKQASIGDDARLFWQEMHPRHYVYLSAPIYDGSGKLAGVIVGLLNWNWADDRQVSMVSNDDAIAVVDRNGKVLFGQNTGSRLLTEDQLSAMRANKRGAFIESIDNRNMLSGFTIQTGFRDLKSLGWIVIARRSADVAFAPAHQLALMLFGVGLLVTMLGIGLGAVFVNRAARPLLVLTAAAERIGRDPNATSLPRQRGSVEVVHLSAALRSLLIRLGFAQNEVDEVKRLATEQTHKLEDDINQLKELAGKDPLTGVLNRRAFLALANEAISNFKRYGHRVSAFVVDIDDFKLINDRYGHHAGDDVIRMVGETLNGLVRTSDKVARFGGEEFVVMLRETSADEAAMLADKMRIAISERALQFRSTEIKVTVSVGAAVVEEHDRDFEELLDRADAALYRAKSDGKNCARMAEKIQLTILNSAA